MSRDLAAILVEDLRRCVERLERSPQQPSDQARTAFHH